MKTLAVSGPLLFRVLKPRLGAQVHPELGAATVTDQKEHLVMRSIIIPALCLAVLTVVTMTSGGVVRAKREAEPGGQAKKTSQVGAEQQDPSTIKIETSLVTVPVIASDRNDVYIPDLRQEEFSIYEDGVKQEIVFFAAVKEPFHVVLMLDTSASTQEKLGQIQRAASAFVAQLQPADRVKIISFDDEVRELGDFTNDREALRRAIEETRPGRELNFMMRCASRWATWRGSRAARRL